MKKRLVQLSIVVLSAALLTACCLFNKGQNQAPQTTKTTTTVTKTTK